MITTPELTDQMMQAARSFGPMHFTIQAWCPIRKWRITAQVTERAFPCEIRFFYVGEVWQLVEMYLIHPAPGYGAGDCCESQGAAFDRIKAISERRLRESIASIREIRFTQMLIEQTQNYDRIVRELRTEVQRRVAAERLANIAPLEQAA